VFFPKPVRNVIAHTGMDKVLLYYIVLYIGLHTDRPYPIKRR